MGNRVISYNFSGFEVFLKLPVIFLIRFCENAVVWKICKDKYQYISIPGVGGGMHGLLHISRLLFIKTETLQEHNLYYSQIRQRFHLIIFFLGCTIKKIRKVDINGPTLIFLGSEQKRQVF